MIISGGFRMHPSGAAWRMLINIPVWGEKNYVSKRWMDAAVYLTSVRNGLVLWPPRLLGCVFESDWIEGGKKVERWAVIK